MIFQNYFFQSEHLLRWLKFYSVCQELTIYCLKNCARTLWSPFLANSELLEAVMITQQYNSSVKIQYHSECKVQLPWSLSVETARDSKSTIHTLTIFHCQKDPETQSSMIVTYIIVLCIISQYNSPASHSLFLCAVDKFYSSQYTSGGRTDLKVGQT